MGRHKKKLSDASKYGTSLHTGCKDESLCTFYIIIGLLYNSTQSQLRTALKNEKSIQESNFVHKITHLEMIWHLLRHIHKPGSSTKTTSSIYVTDKIVRLRVGLRWLCVKLLVITELCGAHMFSTQWNRDARRELKIFLLGVLLV